MTMTIGVLQVEISVTDAMSLKDKRRVVKSIKDRIAHGHNVSIAEVGARDGRVSAQPIGHLVECYAASDLGGGRHR